MSTRNVYLLLICSVFLISSCVTTDNIVALQRQITELNYELDILKKSSLDTKATSGANYDTVMEEVKKIRGAYEEKTHDFSRAAEEIAVLREVVNRTTADIEARLYDIERRLTVIETKLGIAPTSQPAGPTGPSDSVSGTGSVTGDPSDDSLTPEELYAAAYKKFQDNDYDGAERGFRRFIERSPDSSLADNAQFWIGEIYYARKSYERAILEYDAVIKKYPSGDKVPSAMLKQGFAFLELNDTAHAKTIFSEIVKKYPKEPQAETAGKKLETL
ncbi:MAG: tol-pal system protein YbgF [Candidatus Dadabacteria bacterium]|nr:tol-pal system protein YbgF [Candidatus Dadabacteria bacterium]